MTELEMMQRIRTARLFAFEQAYNKIEERIRFNRLIGVSSEEEGMIASQEEIQELMNQEQYELAHGKTKKPTSAATDIG